jgi:BirA family transcriptional regulator, biotin operon repressor / biotin---[acetyl-CoA-carboxylase] ligase
VTGQPAPLALDAIRSHLATRVVGMTLLLHDEVNSTNRVLADLSHQGAPDGTVVVAESQTAGRGRLGRTWLSPRGLNLYVSILLARTLSPETVNWTPMLAAVAVLRVIRALTTLDVRLKWPNDVHAVRGGEGRKLAGILVDAIGPGPAARRAMVVGIGINVNMPVEAFPEELRATATSLLIETGSPVDRGRLLAMLLGEVERLYDHACAHGPSDIAAAYRAACDSIGKRVWVELIGSEKIEGTAEGLASDGALRLRTKNGKALEIRAGDVVHLR